MLSVPDAKRNEFLLILSGVLGISRYATQPGDKQTYVYYTEVLSDVFPFFLDFDILTLPDSTQPVTDGLKLQWSETLQKSFMRPLAPCNEDLVSSECIVRDANIAPVRDSLDPCACIVMTASDRTVSKGGQEYTKTGIHMVWPNVLVSRETAKLLRTLAVTALREHHSGRDWEDIIDTSVYDNVSSLRMIGNYKVKVCTDCKTDTVKELLATETARRKRVQAVFGLAADSTPKQVFDFCYHKIKSLLRSGSDSDNSDIKMLTEYRNACAALPACTCKGKYKITDLQASCYTPYMAMNADGERMQELEQTLHNDIFLQLYMCSVQRDNRSSQTVLKVSPHCPPITEVKWSTESTASSDGERQVEVFRGIRSPTLKPNELKRKQMLENSGLLSMVQQYIRTNMGLEYKQKQVQALYRLYAGSKKADFYLDGTAPFTVIATVLGFGSKFCNAARRDHTNNVIYFMFTPDQACLQMCRSTKLEACKKVCKRNSKVVSYQICTLMFPFSRLTVSVPDDEANSWAANTMSKEHLMRNRVRRRMQRIPEAYRVFVGNNRRQEAATLARLDAEDMKRILKDQQSDKPTTDVKKLKTTDALNDLDRSQEDAVFFDDDENDMNVYCLLH